MQPSSCPVSTRVEFSILQPQHVEEAVACLAEAFMDEPICGALGLPQEALADFLRPRIEITAREGLSCVALEDGKVVSVAFNDDNSEAPVPYANSQQWDTYLVPIFTLLEQLHQGSAMEQQLHAEGVKFFHMFFWATQSQARGKGYLRKLVEMSLEIAKAKGFERLLLPALRPLAGNSTLSWLMPFPMPVCRVWPPSVMPPWNFTCCAYSEQPICGVLPIFDFRSANLQNKVWKKPLIRAFFV